MNFQAKLEKLASGEPPSESSGLFGSEFSKDESKVIVIGVPWDATASYHKGAAQTPNEIIPPSHQLDLENPWTGSGYSNGIFYETIEVPTIPPNAPVKDINEKSAVLNFDLETQCTKYLKSSKKIGLLGGDHSCPYGLVKALANIHQKFSILHIDAHHDLRNAYEGYTHSHASIMYNISEHIPQVSKIVSVGIRDYSQQEKLYAQSLPRKIKTFYDFDLKTNAYLGKKWHEQCAEILESLGEENQPVYISCDVDGLDPQLAPATGTPVPGGVGFSEFAYLLSLIKNSNRTVLGFDLCESAPGKYDNDWNLNVAARILYYLAGLL